MKASTSSCKLYRDHTTGTSKLSRTQITKEGNQSWCAPTSQDCRCWCLFTHTRRSWHCHAFPCVENRIVFRVYLKFRVNSQANSKLRICLKVYSMAGGCQRAVESKSNISTTNYRIRNRKICLAPLIWKQFQNSQPQYVWNGLAIIDGPKFLQKQSGSQRVLMTGHSRPLLLAYVDGHGYW
jgi:hypothetical protein